MKKPLLPFCMFIYFNVWLFAQDVAGGKDHPVLTRYPGAVIG